MTGNTGFLGDWYFYAQKNLGNNGPAGVRFRLASTIIRVPRRWRAVRPRILYPSGSTRPHYIKGYEGRFGRYSVENTLPPLKIVTTGCFFCFYFFKILKNNKIKITIKNICYFFAKTLAQVKSIALPLSQFSFGFLGFISR